MEFNSSKNYLHKNRGENDYTVAGIYKSAHPNWVGWDAVAIEMHNAGMDIEKASQALYRSYTFTNMVKDFYKAYFWLKMKLDQVVSQKIADELFTFGVNAGTKNAIRKAQKVVGEVQDGIIGPMTIKALNAYDEHLFDMQFDEVEKQYYASIIERKPSFKIFENGWNNRADMV